MAHATTTITADLAAGIARQQRVLARRMTKALAGDTTGVHRARVASRRLRELVAVAEAAGSPGDAARLRRAVRRLTRALGPIRELDVSIHELELAARRHAWRQDAVAFVRRRLERERERRGADLAGRYDRTGIATRVRELAHDIAAADEGAWWRALAGRAVNRAGEAGRAAAACGTIYAPERLHALRIATKKLRYALELLPAMPGLETRRAVARLKRVQDRFGHLHDLQVLVAKVQAIESVRQATATGRWVATIADDLERDCREAHAQALPLVPDVADVARAVRRELGPRRRTRHLPMARAVVGQAPRRPAATGR